MISLVKVEDKFKDSEVISKESLKKVGLLGKIKASDRVKLLGSATITKKLVVKKEVLLSKSALASIKKAGGTLQ